MRCPSCGHKEAQAGLVCENCGSYVPKLAAARAAAYDPDSELDDEELYEAPESRGRRLLRMAFNPFGFHALPEREELLPFILMTVSIGVVLGLPGLALGLWLMALEEQAWASIRSPGSEYASLQDWFMLPAVLGLMIFFSGLYRSLLVGWPWLNSSSTGAYLSRFGVAIVMLGGAGAFGFFLVLMLARQ
jgi:hypothetical protein